MNRLLLFLLISSTLIAAGGCTVRKNTSATRNYQAFITRYNVYFNGKEHYDETVAAMEKDYQDDYSRLLPLHPAEMRGNGEFPQPAGSFTRSIEKSQKAIQLRSIKKRPRREPGHKNDPEYREWLKREEYNPFLHNAWMLMAKSQFMDGDFLGAASTFFYITNHFTWLPSTVTEARIWLARSYCAAKRVNEADAVLKRVRTADLTNGNLKGQYAFVRAEIDIARGRYAEAIPSLKEAAGYASGRQSQRLRYLLGQLYLREGDFPEARREFEKIEKTPSAPHAMRFNARIRRSEAITGSDIDSKTMQDELKSLGKLARYESNSQYLDQIYYAMGNIYLATGDTAKAEESLAKAIGLSQRKSTDMALAAVALGNLYFRTARYDKAQPNYAMAVNILPENYAGIKELREKSDILDKLAVYSNTIAVDDSLLRLAELPRPEIYAIVDKKIERLQKEEKERLEREKERLEQARNQPIAVSGTTGQAIITPQIRPAGTETQWYFYNPTLREQGKQEFRRLWGNRRQEDNWRRSERNDPAEFTDDPAARQSGDLTELSDTLPGIYTREYYLRDIPFAEEDKLKLKAQIADALFEMGLLLKNELEDNASSSAAWLRFLKEFPDDARRKDVLYNLFMMASADNKNSDAQRWREMILSEFPESPEGVAVKDPRYIDRLKEMNANQEKLYEETYRNYLENRNGKVLENVAFARKNYPLSPILPKFIFLEALTYVTAQQPLKVSELLREITEKYPSADVSPLSAEWLRQLDSGRQLAVGEGNLTGWMQTRLFADSAAVSTPTPQGLDFAFDENAPHFVLIAFPADIVDPNSMLFEIARYNFNTFTVRDFDISLNRYGRIAVVRLAGFDNRQNAEHYHTLVSSALPPLLPEEARVVVISEGDFNLLLNGGRSLADYLEALEMKTDTDVHRAVLPDAEYPSPQEMYGEFDDEPDDSTQPRQE